MNMSDEAVDALGNLISTFEDMDKEERFNMVYSFAMLVNAIFRAGDLMPEELACLTANDIKFLEDVDDLSVLVDDDQDDT